MQHYYTTLHTPYICLYKNETLQNPSQQYTTLHNFTQLFKLYKTCVQNFGKQTSQNLKTLYTTLHNFTQLHTTLQQLFQTLFNTSPKKLSQTLQHCTILRKFYETLQQFTTSYNTSQHFT